VYSALMPVGKNLASFAVSSFSQVLPKSYSRVSPYGSSSPILTMIGLLNVRWPATLA